MAPTIFFHIFSIYFFNYLVKNQQTTNAPIFLTHNISAIGGVFMVALKLKTLLKYLFQTENLSDI